MDNNKDLLVAYSNYVLKHNERPKNVFTFSEDIGISESEFYQLFSSFESLEKSFFSTFFDNAVTLISEYPDYSTMSSTDKILTFYYTYFQILTENKSLVTFLLHHQNGLANSYKLLSSFKKCFNVYVKGLELNFTGISNIVTENIASSVLPNAVWTQFLAIFKFWLSDKSKGFEKTDVFIEKSVRAGNDILDLSKLSSILDLGKFLYNEKVKM